MKETNRVQKKKILNIPALISLLLVPLLAVGVLLVLLNRMYQVIPLRDRDLSSIFIFLVITLVLGVGMLVMGIIALVMNKRKVGVYNGTWMAVVGIVFGTVCTIAPIFFLVDYMVALN